MWNLCNEILFPACAPPRLWEQFRLPVLLSLPTDDFQIHLPIPQGMQQEVQWFYCGKKKSQENFRDRKVKKLMIKVLKSSGIDLHPRLPQLYYPVPFFVFVLFCSFCESQNNCIKNLLMSVSLRYFCSFSICFFFFSPRVELNLVNLICSSGCMWDFFSHFGLREGLRRNLLILMETFEGSLILHHVNSVHFTRCKSLQRYSQPKLAYLTDGGKIRSERAQESRFSLFMEICSTRTLKGCGVISWRIVLVEQEEHEVLYHNWHTRDEDAHQNLGSFFHVPQAVRNNRVIGSLGKRCGPCKTPGRPFPEH